MLAVTYQTRLIGVDDFLQLVSKLPSNYVGQERIVTVQSVLNFLVSYYVGSRPKL